MGPFRYLATMFACRVGVDPAQWSALERALQDVATRHGQPPASWWGVSTLAAHGVIVRGLALAGHTLLAALPDFWRVAKRMLYDEEAIPPRKVY